MQFVGAYMSQYKKYLNMSLFSKIEMVPYETVGIS